MKRRLIRIAVLLGVLFVALNVVAFFHSWRMTHFVVAGLRTKSPDQLSALGKIGVLLRGVEIPKPVCGAPPAGASTETFFTRDNVKLEAWVMPANSNRAVAVMFHGHGASKSTMMGQAEVLQELGVRTLLVDFRGSGGSDGMTTTLGWRESADVAAATAWARARWPDTPLILYGTSMGAAAVLRAIAVEKVQADGIIVECPFDNLLRTVSHRYHTMGLPAFPFAELLVFWGGVQHGFNAFALRPAEYARAVTCPALVLDGERDLWVRPEEARRVAAAMRGPTECHIFRDGGHAGYWRDAADEYRTTVGAWLSAQTANQKSGNEK